jgi:predicted nucleic acid-binding protein
MRRLFADTFYWVALLYRRDPWHVRVAAFSETITETDSVFTTDAVLTEVLAALSAGGAHLRAAAVALVDDLLNDPQVHVVEVPRSLFLDGVSLYRTRPDKEYSLTDCISMRVMRREALTDVLTNDHHFTQEGFHILFP